VDGAKGAGGGDQLDEFRTVTEGPLGPKGAGQGGPKSEGLARAVEVEDRGEGGKSSRESEQRAKEGRGASRERNTRSSHGRTRHIRHGERGELRGKKGEERRRRLCEKPAERETVIGQAERKGQHRIGTKRRESSVIGRKRWKRGEEKRIDWRGWKIEARGRDSDVSGRIERAKRRGAREEIVIGGRARRAKVWGGGTLVRDAAGWREGRGKSTR
jgi:hypothetical protein